MKTITVSRRARTLKTLLQKARRENLILKAPEGDEFILAEIDDFGREIGLARQNKELMKLLETRAKRRKLISLEETKARLGLR